MPDPVPDSLLGLLPGPSFGEADPFFDEVWGEAFGEAFDGDAGICTAQYCASATSPKAAQVTKPSRQNARAGNQTSRRSNARASAPAGARDVDRIANGIVDRIGIRIVVGLPWLLSALWLLAPWSVGSVISRASTETDRVFTVTVGIGLWAVWGVALLASLLRRPWSLTTLRLATTAAVALTIACVIWVGTGDTGTSGTAASTGTGELTAALASLAIVHMVITAAVSLLPEVGNAFVDGLSYGNERRLLLRAPIGVLVGPLPLAWAVAIVGAAAGPLALANEQWVLATVLTVVGWPLAVVAVRSMHQLARRWVVFVPNGFVLIDSLTAHEPVVLLRKQVQQLIPTPADVDLLAEELVDLSANALGVPLLATLSAEVEVLPRQAVGRSAKGVVGEADAGGAGKRAAKQTSKQTSKQIERVHATKVLFSPTRPGVALATAIDRRIGVSGSPS